MKKIILILLFIPLVSFGQDYLNTKDAIDKTLSEIKPMLPIDLGDGIIWKDAINENNTNRVYVYEIDKEALDYVLDDINKISMMQSLVSMNQYEFTRNNRINVVYRYYYKDVLFKEITIKHGDWDAFVSLADGNNKEIDEPLNGFKIGYPKGFTKVSSDDRGEIYQNDNIKIQVIFGKASFDEEKALELLSSDLGGNEYINHTLIDDFKIKIPIGYYFGSDNSFLIASIFIIKDHFYSITVAIKPKSSNVKKEEWEGIFEKGNKTMLGMITNFVSENDLTDEKHKELLSEYPIIAGKGWGEIKIGTTKNEVEEFLLSKGNVKAKYDDVYFVDYKNYGVQINYFLDDTVNVIFLYNNMLGYEYLDEMPLKTNKKINWNSTLAQIKEAYGEPIKYYSGKEIWLPDQTKTEGSYERLEYNGINFRFENNKLVRIGIRKQSKP